MSGCGNHATQGTSSKRPLYKTSGINSKKSIQFDGTDDYLATPSLTLTTATILAVVQKDGGVFGGVIKYAPTYDDAANNGYLDFFTGTYWVHGTPSTSTYYRYIDPTTNGVGYQSSTAFGAAGSDLVWRVDQTALTLHANAGYTQPSGSMPLFVGAGYSTNTWNGKIAELIVYDNILSPSTRLVIEQYLKNKWGTP